MMLVGIDWGQKYVWVAKEVVGIVFPVGVFLRGEVLQSLHTLFVWEEVDFVVWVATRNRVMSKQEKLFQTFLLELKHSFPGSLVFLQDEDLSTFEAEGDTPKTLFQKRVDEVAASIILQRYIDSLKK